MQSKQVLAISENSALIHNVSSKVLESIAPDEVPISAGFLDAVIATIAKGETATLNSSDMPGGLGGTDWALLVIVPAVVTLITNFLVRGNIESVTMLKNALNLTSPEDIAAQIRIDDVKVIINNTGARWNRRKIKKFIKLISIALWQCLEEDAILYTGIGQGLPTQVYQSLYTVLLRCGPFKSDHELRAVFLDDRIVLWYDKVPQAISLEARIRGVIDLLYQQYTIAQENALVLFLRVLADHKDAGDACQQELVDMIRTLNSIIGKHKNE